MDRVVIDEIDQYPFLLQRSHDFSGMDRIDVKLPSGADENLQRSHDFSVMDRRKDMLERTYASAAFNGAMTFQSWIEGRTCWSALMQVPPSTEP